MLSNSTSQAVGQTFYKNLFREHPELRSMFNMSNQEAQVNIGINMLYFFLPQGRGSVRCCGGFLSARWAGGGTGFSNCQVCKDRKSLGTFFACRIIQRHVALDVRPEQYSVVGNTLLDTLEVLHHCSGKTLLESLEVLHHCNRKYLNPHPGGIAPL